MRHTEVKKGGREVHKLILDVEQENALIRIEVKDPMELAQEMCEGFMWLHSALEKSKIKEQEKEAAQTEA